MLNLPEDQLTKVTTQAREGIETYAFFCTCDSLFVTTQAHEGIETAKLTVTILVFVVTTQACEGIEIVEHTFFSYSFTR